MACRRLLTIPGIGPRTTSELVVGIDIAEFGGHDKPAPYCGPAPRNRQPGTSISSVTASRQGSEQLKNLLMFSCNPLAGSDDRLGEFCRKCRDRGMPYGKAPKAVARKRLKVIYAIMRDQVPYVVQRAASQNRNHESAPARGRGGAFRPAGEIAKRIS